MRATGGRNRRASLLGRVPPMCGVPRGIARAETRSPYRNHAESGEACASVDAIGGDRCARFLARGLAAGLGCSGGGEWS